ncbi:CDP-diacylglycerol--glycerol-3-phosphate 3-phosphatidyltransferase [Fannyhessea vaginae PB189-T1-4]|uniref:CDP-diacylglycerol--glycerol-3-phosphate 3-phosphatidyltransferase n=1 Tax=Fannyhessea vaginae PB189-T1-4 TaxID=866774 RepID=A0ABP2IYM0_9ACTN|nr:CDP-diacylglycerol--glycerol-3-phosphate 3-phosphatidyltransferase [Fannyhessea vaginae]EFL43752.1 CDP-diacylglycerol--glycerol-3-phosphate 3-phosphatidyltransferase [Fannyhessea vaginae PB189-T1-4]
MPTMLTSTPTSNNAASPVGRSSICTLANIVTAIRILAVPVWLAVAQAVAQHALFDGATLDTCLVDAGHLQLGYAIVFVLFCIISLTDKLDGYLARSRGEISTLGKFLDPIADKILVLGALCFLLEQTLVSSWVILIILTRELLVSALRMVVATSGSVIAASQLGKWKTATTMVALCGILLSLCFDGVMVSFVLFCIGSLGMIIAVILTIWSGIDYFIKSWPVLVGDEHEHTHTRSLRG